MALNIEVGLSPGDFVLDGNPYPLPNKGAEPPIFVSCLLRPNGYPDATWYGFRPRPTRHCVRWRPTSPPLKGHSLSLLAIVRCGQKAGWTKIPLGMEVGLGPCEFVFDGHQASPSKKGTPNPTQFLAHLYCGQTAEWIKTSLGTEVDLGQATLDGVPALHEIGTAAPSFWPMSIVATVAHLSYCKVLV